jgi:hypothetical protein
MSSGPWLETDLNKEPSGVLSRVAFNAVIASRLFIAMFYIKFVDSATIRSAIFNGRCGISPDTTLRLSRSLGRSAAFSLNL